MLDGKPGIKVACQPAEDFPPWQSQYVTDTLLFMCNYVPLNGQCSVCLTDYLLLCHMPAPANCGDSSKTEHRLRSFTNTINNIT